MKNATLIYEPALAGYSLKFDYDRDVLEFFKKIVPSHLRKGEPKIIGTYYDRRTNTNKDKIEWTWYFGEEFFDVVKLLFQNHRAFTLKIVTREDVERLAAEQQATRDTWRPSTQQISIEDELRKLYELIPKNGTSFEQFKELSRNDAAKLYRKGAMVYHPDRNASPEAAVKMAELNNVWNVLKEAYFIK